MKIESHLMTEKRRSLRGAWVVILVLLLAAAGATVFFLQPSAPQLHRRFGQQHVLATDLEHYRGGADRNTLSGRLERSQATLARQGFERVKVAEGDRFQAQ